jgi:hypothetical protein
MAQAKQRPPGGKRQANQPKSNQPTPPKNQPTEPSPQRLSAAERRAQHAAEAKRQQQRRQTRNLLIGLAVASLLAVAAFFVIRNQLALQGIGVEVPNEGAEHVNDGTPLTFQHIPPSSGNHYPSAQPAGIYPEQEINEGYWIHSLEHGYVVALVKCTDNCAIVFDQLEGIYDDVLKESRFGNVKFIATKYSKPFTNGNSPLVTLVAWNHEMELDTVDQQQIERFYNKFVDQGPENVP